MRNWKQLSPSLYHPFSLGPVFGISDIGLTRQSNEDNFLIDCELGLVALADGMGGHDGGEIASASALLGIRDFIRAAVHEAPTQRRTPGSDPDATWSDSTMPALSTIFAAIDHANTRLHTHNLADQYDDGCGMGTTLTGLWHYLDNGWLVVFQVGDSRLYRYRDGALSLLTRDQTLYQQAFDQGQRTQLPKRNLLLQAVGPKATVRPVVQAHACQAGDVYLLCSDGLYGNTPDSTIATVLQHAQAQTLEVACLQLIDLAKKNGNTDNITAVLLYCER